jgi:hypothetical protein
MNDRVQRQTRCIDENMPLFGFDFLPRVVTMRVDRGPLFQRTSRSG